MTQAGINTSMKITIVTATFNRKDLLKRLYESLIAQKYEAIEWIVVDDGGTDNSEEAVREFQKDAAFEIRYVRKENGGKDGAVNVGLGIATGELVAVIDDDDSFVPNMFTQVASDYARIANDKNIAGLSYLTADAFGKVWGRTFPRDHMISNHFDCRINRKIWGDKCEFTKGSVLRGDHIRFLETKTKGGFGSDVMFLATIAEKYDTCYVNTPVLNKNYYETGIGVNWRKRGLQNPELAAAYYACYLHRRIRPFIRLRYMIAYLANAHYAGYPMTLPLYYAPWNRVFFYLAYLPGLFIGSRWKQYRRADSYPQARKWMRSKG